MVANIYDLIIWLSGAGAVIAVSWICERIPAFLALDSAKKRWIQYGLSVLVACIALAVQQYVPKEYLAMVAPYFGVAISIFGLLFVNQASHTLDPKRDRQE